MNKHIRHNGISFYLTSAKEIEFQSEKAAMEFVRSSKANRLGFQQFRRLKLHVLNKQQVENMLSAFYKIEDATCYEDPLITQMVNILQDYLTKRFIGE